MSSFVSLSGRNILILTKTWPTGKIADPEIIANLPNLHLFYRDRDNRRGGGVLISGGIQLSLYTLNATSNLEVLWLLCLSLSSPQSVIISVCYRPPNKSPEFSYDLNSSVSQVTSTYSKAHVMLLGDFNFPSNIWNDTNSLSLHSNSETRIPWMYAYVLTSLNLFLNQHN